MPAHEKINYVEYPSRDLPATKAFFQAAFGWRFTDYGPDYAAFADEGLDGGFFSAEMSARSDDGSALIVFYSAQLEALKQRRAQAFELQLPTALRGDVRGLSGTVGQARENPILRPTERTARATERAERFLSAVDQKLGELLAHVQNTSANVAAF